jgi:hypothetical protein
MADERWFQVLGSFEVKAVDQDEAIRKISDAVTTEKVPGLFPVGTFDAREVDDPIARARRRLEDARR